MDLKQALARLSDIIPEIKTGKYDGIIVKKLEASNTLDAGRVTKQTHIAITGNQMDIFPYLYAPGYFERGYDNRDEDLKKYYIVHIPVRLFKSNVEKLGEDSSDLPFDGNGQLLTSVSVVRSRRKDAADQVQLSLPTYDDKSFVLFRKKIHAGDYLIILKVKDHFQYEFFGVKASSAETISDLNNTFYKEATNTVVDVSKMIGEKRSDSEHEHADNILLYGVPGAGKSHYIKKNFPSDDEHMERVVFHPDYSFSDFVGQILPVVEGENLKYSFIPGPFTTILKKAYDDEKKDNYYLVIEEINRGNAPAIFGDLFQLLDRDKNGESEYAITNFDIALKVYGDKNHKVRIPSNLWIIATMNTSDQNVFTLDTAFQRRWNMQLIKNDIASAEHANQFIEGSKITWSSFATVINQKILESNQSLGSFGDKRLGAYFAKMAELKANRFPNKVLKYLWDDAFKMNHDYVFADSIDSLECLIETYNQPSEDPLSAVFRKEVYDLMLPKKESTNDDLNEDNKQETSDDIES